MAGENVVSYTDMDIDEAINDLSNGFIDEILLSKTITYAAKQLVIKHHRNSIFAILQGRDVFMANPTGSEKITDFRNDFLGARLHQSSFFRR